MIRLHRPAIPQARRRIAARETRVLWDSWAAGRRLVIKPGVYAHPSIKDALRAAQHHKCAYCETSNPRSHDVVEHFRPKSGWRQNQGDPLSRPQYFWLAYEWDNLLFACDLCNDAGHKQNLFPLANPKQRASPTAPSVAQEKPLLINPYTENPSEFIEWNRDVPRPRRRSRKGAATIQVFGLATDERLIDFRRTHFDAIQIYLSAAENMARGNPDRVKIKTVLLNQLKDAAQFAAMNRESFAARIHRL